MGFWGLLCWGLVGVRRGQGGRLGRATNVFNGRLIVVCSKRGAALVCGSNTSLLCARNVLHTPEVLLTQQVATSGLMKQTRFHS